VAPGRGPAQQHLSTVLERDLDALEAQLTIGDFHTRGDVFDAIGLRGVRIASDDRMQPPSLLRYAPVVRGVASTHARVQVRQGTTLIHDTTVAPGPFALQDVQPLGYGGALDVRVIEADGQVSTFSVPYAAIPGLLRPGQSRFGVAAGRWRGTGIPDGDATDLVFQGTVQRGVHDRLTLQAGAQVAPDYAQALGGVAVSTRVGAFSIDRAQSRLVHDGSTTTGHALRIAYAGRVPATRTTVDVAAWRHGSAGFRLLAEAMHHPARIPGRANTRAPMPACARRSARTVARSRWAWSIAPGARRHRGNAACASAGAFAPARRPVAGNVRPRAVRATGASSGAISLSLPLTTGDTRAVGHAQARVLADTATMLASASGTFESRSTIWMERRTHARHRAGRQPRDDERHTVDAGPRRTRPRGPQRSAHRAAMVRDCGRQRPAACARRDVRLTHGRHGGTRPRTPRTRRKPPAALRRPARRAGRGVVPHLSPYRWNTVGIDPRGVSPDVQFDWTERRVVPRAGAVLDIALPTVRSTLHRLRAIRADGAVAPFRSGSARAGRDVGRHDRPRGRRPAARTRGHAHVRRPLAGGGRTEAMPRLAAVADGRARHRRHACTE
jgi:outer membrane usher protein